MGKHHKILTATLIWTSSERK